MVDVEQREVGPRGVGDAPCDGNWRVRVPSNFATYFLRGKETGEIYAATLDKEEVMLWRKSDFLLWMDLLEQSAADGADEDEDIVFAVQVYGGEAEMDRQGRFVLPKNVRDHLSLSGPKVDFKIISGPIRLTTKERLDTDKQNRVPLSPELHTKTRRRFAQLMRKHSSAGGGHG